MNAKKPKRTDPRPGAAMVKKKVRNFAMVSLGVLACLAAVIALVAAADAGTPTREAARPRRTAVIKLKQWLAYAAAAGTGYPLFGKNPYHRALRILRDDRASIPPIWRSRALARYGIFLATPGWANYTGAVPKKYLDKARRLLHESLALSPRYVNGWIRLAYLQDGYRNAGWSHLPSLQEAARLSPDNPLVEAARAWAIWQVHGAPHMKAGPVVPPGNMGFLSARWRRAFCYRALMYLKYHNAKMEFRVVHFYGSAPVFRDALKFYEPRQLAALKAGRWKPDPAADPWPPPATQPAKKTAATRRAKSAAPGGAK